MTIFHNPKHPLFILLSLFLLIGGIVSYTVKDWVRDNLVQPVIDGFLWLYVIVDSFSQIYLWAFFLVLGTLYMIQSMIGSLQDVSFIPQTREKKLRGSDYLSEIINLMGAEDNRFRQQRLAKYLVLLYFEIIGNRTRYYRPMREHLHHLEHELPPEVMAVFQFGLTWDIHVENNPKWRFLTKHRAAPPLESDESEENISPPPSFPTQAQFDQTLFFLEQQLFMHQEAAFQQSGGREQ